MNDPNPTIILHSIPETCRFLGVRRSKVYALIAEGRLPSVAIGRRRLVRSDHISEFIENL